MTVGADDDLSYGQRTHLEQRKTAIGPVNNAHTGAFDDSITLGGGKAPNRFRDFQMNDRLVSHRNSFAEALFCPLPFPQQSDGRGAFQTQLLKSENDTDA